VAESTADPAPGAIVTDIEGTVGSIRFVRDVLFPYARKRLPAFVEMEHERPEVAHWLHETAKEAGLVEASRGELVELLQRWIDQDRKATPLKALQGMIWEQGYRDGDFTAHLYPDAVARLRAWHAQGIPLYVYSSGSVQAQDLYFGHTAFGDLRPLFSGFFDTEIGAKRETGSYRRIAEEIGAAPGRIAFLSDIAAELDAARATGLRTFLVARPEDAGDAGGANAPATHPVVASFDALPF
jgi:enolase-phosphatase E1